jgi:hypothetical protein
MKNWLLFLWVFCAPVAAGELQTLHVADADFNIEAPDGYCIVGRSSPSEQKLWSGLDKASGKIAILQLTAPCAELNEYISGAADYLNNFAYVGITKTQGEIRKVTFTRAQFIEGSLKARSVPRIDTEEASRVMRKSLEDETARAASAAVEVYGGDALAVYFAVHGTFESRERKSWRMTTLGAMTVAKSFPISVHVVNIAGRSPAESADSVLRSYLARFLRLNSK